MSCCTPITADKPVPIGRPHPAWLVRGEQRHRTRRPLGRHNLDKEGCPGWPPGQPETADSSDTFLMVNHLKGEFRENVAFCCVTTALAKRWEFWSNEAIRDSGVSARWRDTRTQERIRSFDLRSNRASGLAPPEPCRPGLETIPEPIDQGRLRTEKRPSSIQKPLGPNSPSDHRCATPGLCRRRRTSDWRPSPPPSGTSYRIAPANCANDAHSANTDVAESLKARGPSRAVVAASCVVRLQTSWSVPRKQDLQNTIASAHAVTHIKRVEH